MRPQAETRPVAVPRRVASRPTRHVEAGAAILPDDVVRTALAAVGRVGTSTGPDPRMATVADRPAPAETDRPVGLVRRVVGSATEVPQGEVLAFTPVGRRAARSHETPPDAAVPRTRPGRRKTDRPRTGTPRAAVRVRLVVP